MELDGLRLGDVQRTTDAIVTAIRTGRGAILRSDTDCRLEQHAQEHRKRHAYNCWSGRHFPAVGNAADIPPYPVTAAPARYLSAKFPRWGSTIASRSRTVKNGQKIAGPTPQKPLILESAPWQAK